jgi:glycerophosphoryl diester phosphodiesterase
LGAKLREPSRPPLVIAHRGASGSAPENTLPAFERAIALGADMIELDVQLTCDGEVVVIHDWTLDRTTTGSGLVREQTLGAIRRLDAGSWFDPRFRGARIPTLAEVLAAVALPVNVELKPAGDDGLEARCLAVVEGAGADARIVFSSFELAALERLRRCSPAATIAVLWETGPLPEALRAIRRVGARALHLRKDAATTATLAALAAEQVPVRVWTVNDPGEMARLTAAGVEGLFTDHPERFLLSPTPE